MKKLLRNRTFLGIISLVMAFVICFAVAPAINTASAKQTEIVRVTKSIPEGTAITKDMVQSIAVGGYNLPSNVVRDTKSVVGKYTTAALEPGDYILDSKVSDKVKSPYLAQLDGKKQAISISIKSFAAGLSGKLQSGDIISLFVSDYGDTKKTVAPSELKYVKLLAATTAKGSDTDQKDQQKKDDNSESDNIPATLTLLATPEQAAHLVDYETNGKLYAALVYRGDVQNANKYIDMQDQYLNQSSSNTSTGAVQDSSVSGPGGVPGNGE